MATLYRVYRPQNFAQVKGQAAIIQTLKNAVRTGSLAHAYVFTGSRGVGKTSVARLLAKAANCLQPAEGEACLTCAHCTAVATGNFIDLQEIDAASHTGVDNIREIIDHIGFAPVQGKYKVLIIDEVHMLSKPAFNALLKTLEEPPAHALFVLATTDIHKVPATIISRTQRFDFKKISAEDIVEQLAIVLDKEGRSLPDGSLPLIAAKAEGGLRDALSLLGQVLSMGENIKLEDVRAMLGVTDIALHMELLDAIVLQDTQGICAFVDRLIFNGVDIGQFVKDFLEYLRNILIVHMGATVLLPEVLAQSKKINASDVLLCIRLFLKAYKDLGFSPDPSIPLLVASFEAAFKGKVPGAGASAQPLPPPQVVAGQMPKNVPPVVAPVISADSSVQELKKNTDESLSKEEVVAIWDSAIAAIRDVNGPLATLLKNSPLLTVQSGVVTVAVRYLFHKENLESTKNYGLITQTLSSLCGKQLRFEARVVKEEVVVASQGDALASALQVFGGELVN